MAAKPPPAGIYAPAITLFDAATDTLDLTSQAKYFRYLSGTGLTGLVILGTNAETFLLTRPERAALLQCARANVPAGYPLIAGISGHSTAQVLEFAEDAADAGMDYGLLLPPAYFGAAQSTPAVVEAFFLEVAARSRIPIVLYNFPGVCNGVDLTSATIASLVRQSDKIVGVKLTCGSVAKVARLAAELPPERFSTFGGQSDFLIGALASGGAGCIAAFGNVAPHVVVEVYRLWLQGKGDEALKLHQQAALAEGNVKGGVGSVKYAAGLQSLVRAGVGAELEGAQRTSLLADRVRPRKPYAPLSDAAASAVKKGLVRILEIEDQLTSRRTDGI